MKFFQFNRRRGIVALVLLLALLAGAFFVIYPRYQARRKAKSGTETKAPDRIFTAKKGDLILGVMLSGSVNAKKKHKLAMEAPWGTKLIKVVDENKEVKAGEIFTELLGSNPYPDLKEAGYAFRAITLGE